MSWHASHSAFRFPYYWPFVRVIHQSTVNSLHKGPVIWRFDIFFMLLANCWTIALLVIRDALRWYGVNEMKAGFSQMVAPKISNLLIYFYMPVTIYHWLFMVTKYEVKSMVWTKVYLTCSTNQKPGNCRDSTVHDLKFIRPGVLHHECSSKGWWAICHEMCGNISTDSIHNL